MKRSEKVDEVKAIEGMLSGVKAAIVTEYRGLTVDQMTALRGVVRNAYENDGAVKLRVVKNRLAKRALQTVKIEGLDKLLEGPTALATAKNDPVPLAKALVDFAAENEIFKIKGGNIEGKFVDLKQIMALAKLPSREALMSMLLSVMQAPARDLASVLAAVPRGLVTALKGIADKK